ncbi:transmembrane protein 150A [Takifugu flavidus]|uniref:transmembrane protein 150A n=1 Tax=Takifugu flavidus TaxID=433684 RepID=UPI0025441F30|nr:transmembrane protein 150A [Takifugu flavidus]
MVLWVILPVSLALVSFLGTWTVYGLALSNKHVCSLTDWGGENFCRGNHSSGCCLVPTISTSGRSAPESSLFSATINAGAFLFLLFCIFHHAHILEKHACHFMLSRVGLAFGVVAAMGAFAAGNCNPGDLPVLHHLGAAVSFLCICFYTTILTVLTRLCTLSGYERILLPLRVASTVLQIIVTICYTILSVQAEYFHVLLSAVFEWMLSVNLQLFELSFAVEFCFFSSFMLANIFGKQEDEKPLMLTMS